MKLTILLLTTAFLSAGANGLSQTVTLSCNNLEITRVFDTIEYQTGYVAAYNKELLQISRPVTLTAKNMPLKEFLDVIMKGQPLKYEIKKRSIIISGKPFLSEDKKAMIGVIAPPLEIKGRVTDKHNTALSGVNVLLKGTNNGTITDANGNYTIEIPDMKGTLIFSFIGYASQELSVKGRSAINVMLDEDVRDLEGVIVVGYSAKKRSELSSSVSVVSGDDLRDVTSNDVTSLLQGKAAGVVVSSSSGDPNAPPSIIIRGSSSITAGSEPLYVVDGIIGGSANPNDVESITVLKDAAATGLYGSRASNGVIIITTKSGKAGKNQVSFNSAVGFNTVATGKYKVMNSQQLYDYQKTFWNPATWERDRPISLLSQNTNWRDLMFSTGMTNNHAVTVSGGSEKTQMYVSGNYYNEEGTLGPTGNEVFNLRSNITHKISNKLKLSVRLNARSRKMDNEAAGSNFLTTHENMPWDNPNNPDGSLKMGIEEGWIGRDNDNFLHGWQYNFDVARESSLLGDVILEYAIANNLTFSTNNRVSYSNSKRELYYDVRSKAGAGQGRLTNDFANSRQLITSNRLTYGRSFGNHNFTAIAVAEAEKNYSDINSVTTAGLAPGLHVMNAASMILLASSITTENAFSKGLVQVDYNFNNRYFVIGSVIREASSRFGSNNRAANFYTLGTSWILTNEEFMKGQRTFDMLKVRASYGITGNAQIGDYQTLGLYSFSAQHAGNSGSFPFQLVNDNLSWEKAKTMNLGLDIGFFKRISLNIDLYDKTTSELLLNVQLPYTSGFSSVIRNVGSVRNRGVEINLNTINLKGALQWETNFNIAFNRSKVLALDQGKDILTVGVGFNPTRNISVGHDLNSWYMRKWAGVDPSNGDPLWEVVTTDANGGRSVSTTNQYKDATIQFVGSYTPDFTGGMNNVFTYKAFSLSAFLSFVSGVQVWNTSALITDSDGAYDTENQRVLQDGESRWQKEGDIATHPRAVFGGNLNANSVSSRYLQDGSYIRLRNVKFSYELPQGFLSRAKISDASVFISGDNLWTGTSFTGRDPQASLSNSGGQVGEYPISKKILLGINIRL